MTKPPKDIGASVRSRLLHLARKRGEDFQLLLTRYANEQLITANRLLPPAPPPWRGSGSHPHTLRSGINKTKDSGPTNTAS